MNGRDRTINPLAAIEYMQKARNNMNANYLTRSSIGRLVDFKKVKRMTSRGQGKYIVYVQQVTPRRDRVQIWPLWGENNAESERLIAINTQRPKNT